MRMKYQLVLILSALFCVFCTPQKDMIEYTPAEEKGSSGKFEPLDDSGLKALFYLDVPSDCILSRTGGTKHAFSSNDQIYSRMETFSPVQGGDGRFCVEVPSSQAHNYRMFLYPGGCKSWYMESAPLKGLMIPYSQFYGKTISQMSTFPLYGEYSEKTGNTIVFKDIYSVLKVAVQGAVEVSSVHIENNETDPVNSFYLAGLANYDPEGGYKVGSGVNFINLNCLDSVGNGVLLTQEGKVFYLIIAPGDYKKGLTLSVSDKNHKAQEFNIPPFAVTAGEIKDLGLFSYEPSDNLLFYERFDNFVWGGNVKDSESMFASFAPDAVTNLDENPTSRSGFENALTKISNTTAGSALIQSTYTAGYTVDQRHAVSDEYVVSRNIGDYNYMYRCQEFQGCISAGATDAIRGLVNLVNFTGLDKGLYKVFVDFDIAFRYGSTDEFALQITKSGIVRNVTIDGKPLELKTTIDGNNTYTHSFLNRCLMSRKDLVPPTSVADASGWHHVEVEAWNFCEVSDLVLEGATTDASLKHGFYLDNIRVRVEPMPRGNLRVLYMNIQNGMWADQGNNFDNFVSWVKKYDPDICVWCESRTLYKTGTDKSVSSDSERFLCKTMGSATDEGWKNLAARYGHQYHSISGFRDNYPQVITSKYPITTLGRYTSIGSGKNIQHGAGMFSVTVGGKTLKIVTLHLWPQLYAPSSNTAASAAALQGRDHQVLEINKILDLTNPVPTECFLMMGDHNAISRIDSWYYEANHLYEVVTTKWNTTPLEFTDGVYREKWYQANDRIIANGAYDDMIRKFWPGKFIASTGGAGRIDLMYGTPVMTEKLVNMTAVHDSWSTIVSGKTVFSLPSDHLPILADFNF